jgi:hypothetical protein
LVLRNGYTEESLGGAAIAATDTSTVILQNCTVVRHTSTSLGGAISSAGAVSIQNCIFRQCSGAYGAAVRNTGGILSIDSSLFDSNTAVNAGAVFAISGVDVNIQNTTWTNNTAEQGSALSVAELCSVTLSGCKFQGNTAESGAAVSVSNQTDVIAINTVFVDNRAATAAAIVLATNVKAVFKKASVQN